MDDLLTNVFLLIVFMMPVVVLFGVGIFIVDHWDDSKLTFSTWFMIGYPSPWRYANRILRCHKYNRMCKTKKFLLEKLEIDPKSLISSGRL